MSKIEVYTLAEGWRNICGPASLHIYDGGIPHKVKSGDWVWANSQWNMLCPIELAWVGGSSDPSSSEDLNPSDFEVFRNHFWNLSLSRPLVGSEEIEIVFDWSLVATSNNTGVLIETLIDLSTGVDFGDILGNGNELSKGVIKAGSNSGNVTITLTALVQTLRVGMRTYINDAPFGGHVAASTVELNVNSKSGSLVGITGPADITTFIDL